MSNKIKKRLTTPSKATFNLGHALQEAICHHQAGRFDEAEALYRKILGVSSKEADALNLLATLYQQKGDGRSAIPLLQTAIALRPERADYHSNLGSAQRSTGKRDKAIASFSKAIALNPGHLEAQFNLAMTHFELGDLPAAASGFQKILHTKPSFILAREMLAKTFSSQGLLDEALACYHKITQLDPNRSVAFCEIGNILQAQGKLTEAAATYQQAIRLSPDFAVAHNNLGNTLVKQGKLHPALACYQEALRFNPDLGEAHVNLSWAFKEHGMIGEGLACLQRYLNRHPEDHRAHSDLLFFMNYDPAYSPEQLYTAAQAWWQQHAPSGPALFARPTCQPREKLRIGFLSPDFRQHPVGTFLLPLFKTIDPQEVSLYCYAEMLDQQMDPISHLLRDLATSWVSTVGLSAPEAARCIHHDQIDILIDLAGHSAGNRLDIMALQAAPRQVSWLGYVNTTGLSVINYRLTDAVADPPGSEPYYSETLFRLPDHFFCYEPPTSAPDIGELPAMANGYITFGSLNNPNKITPEVLSLWSRILLQTPNSRLVMLGSPFADEFIKNYYLELFARHEVAPDRLELLSTMPMHDYLKLYNRIDIALDPFPHNGHTISCHTLWMGVPVITLAGNRYASRMGASILTGIGLPGLIAHSPEEYLQIALALAHDLDQLTSARRTLRERLQRSAMCDSRRFTKNFVQAMHNIRDSQE